MGKWRFEFSENGLRGSVGQCWVRLGVSAWTGQVERVLPPSRGASGRVGPRCTTPPCTRDRVILLEARLEEITRLASAPDFAATAAALSELGDRRATLLFPGAFAE